MVPGHCGLDDHIHVVGVERDKLVHTAEVYADAPTGRGEVAFEGGAARVGRYGNAAGVTDLHDGGDVDGGEGLDDAKRAVGGEVGVGGPGGAGVCVQVIGGGGDVVDADDVLKVCPGGLEVGLGDVVRWGLGGGD